MRCATLFAVLVLLQSRVLAVDPDADRVPWVPTNDVLNVTYWGTVTEITKDSITIQFPNKKIKPKPFPVSEDLAAGKIPMKTRVLLTPRGTVSYEIFSSYMYRLTDVKVGDWVSIRYSHLGNTDTCDHIKITKRPGGRVPPVAKEAEELDMPKSPVLRAKYIPYHEWINAYWDLEDKGIPFPEKFGDERRWPVAPLPREVRPNTTP